MDCYTKYQTKQYTHAHTHTLILQQMAASTWLGDHQGRPSAPVIHRINAIDILARNQPCNNNNILVVGSSYLQGIMLTSPVIGQNPPLASVAAMTAALLTFSSTEHNWK